MHELIRATPENAAFQRLEAQWHKKFGKPPGTYVPLLKHAEKIACENPQDPRYGIFVLVENFTKRGEHFAGLAHVNHMHPKSKKPVLRMVWNLLSPEYAGDQVKAEEVAELTTAYIFGGLKICHSQMRSTSLKIYLQNLTERRFAAGIASALRYTRPAWGVAIRGQWLHIDNVPKAGGSSV